MTALVRFAYVMALRRAISGWRLESVLFGGILLAVALMASGVIFSDLLSNAALRHALSEAEPNDANFWVRSFSSQDDPRSVEGRRAAFEARAAFTQDRVALPFEPYLKNQSRYLETATFFFEDHPQLELDNEVRPRGSVVHMTELFPDRVRLVRGEWPGEPGGSGSPLNVAVDVLGTQLLQLDVGDVLGIYPAASFTDPPSTPVRIVGVFERVNPEDEFWYGTSSSFSRQDDRWTLVPLFTSEEIVIDRLLGAYPALYTDTTWYFFLDREGMRASQVDAVQQIIANAQRDVQIGLRNSSFFIRLDNVLRSFDEQLLLARVPLFLVVFLVTGILVYYLALVAGLIVRSRTSEIAMLKSRGATTLQVGFLGFGEGLLLAAPAVAIGPFLAVGVVKVLGSVFFGLGGGSEELSGVPVGVTQEAFLLGLAGGVLAVAVFTIATLAAARHGIVEARQSGARPPTASFLHRYYLDLVLLALIGLLWWQIQSRGAFLVQSVGTQELKLDYSLLLGPVLGLMAAGLVIMRVFPWFAALLSRIVGPVGPSWLVHSLRHVARDPMVPGVLIVLLTLATALGVMGSAFSATLERSQRERALYDAGADLRFQHSGGDRSSGPDRLASVAEEFQGVEAASDVFRSTAHATTTGFSTSGALLAVDGDRIADVAWFRDDFGGGRSLSELAQALQPKTLVDSADAGIALPPNTTGLALWVRPGSGADPMNLWARLRDSSGQYVDTGVGHLGFSGWSRLTWGLSPQALGDGSFRARPPNIQLVPPYTLMSFHVTSQFSASEPGTFFVGRLDALTPGGGEAPVVDFQNIDGWNIIEDFGRPGLYSLETSEAAAGPEVGTSARFSWSSGGVGLKGFRTGGPTVPLPALVSPSFLEVADARVGDQVILGLSTYTLLIEVAAVVEYFPTLDSAKGPFAVVDLESFFSAANRYSPRIPGGPNELWISTNGLPVATGPIESAMRDAGARVRETHDAAILVAERVDQPLVSAGWGALLVLLFLAIALASASGVMLFSYLDTRDRQTEFALLRTMGSSSGQLRRVVWFNLFLMVVCGVGLGTWIGHLIGTGLLPLMEVAEDGARVTPSMVFTTDWQRLLISYLVLAGVTVLTVLWLAWLSSRIRLQQVLRMGEA